MFAKLLFTVLVALPLLSPGVSQHISPRMQQQQKDVLHFGLTKGDKQMILLMSDQGRSISDICEALGNIKTEDEIVEILRDVRLEHERSMKKITEGKKTQKLKTEDERKHGLQKRKKKDDKDEKNAARKKRDASGGKNRTKNDPRGRGKRLSETNIKSDRTNMNDDLTNTSYKRKR